MLQVIVKMRLNFTFTSCRMLFLLTLRVGYELMPFSETSMPLYINYHLTRWRGGCKGQIDNVLYFLYDMKNMFWYQNSAGRCPHHIWLIWSLYFLCNVGEIIIIIVIIFFTSSIILVTSSHCDLIFDFWSSHLAWHWRETHWHINFIYPNLK